MRNFPLVLRSTCRRIRHKLCDEARPSCSQCSNTGRRCDFAITSHRWLMPPAPVLAMQLTLWHPHPLSDLPDHMVNLCDQESVLFDYFRLVCAKDFALCFESVPWKTLVLQYTRAEPAIYHAALSISALTRSNYHPTVSWNAPLRRTESVSEFWLAQYSLAIRTLNSRLDSSVESIELATIASILFVYIKGSHVYTALWRCIFAAAWLFHKA
jgi:hypothetical protein